MFLTRFFMWKFLSVPFLAFLLETGRSAPCGRLYGARLFVAGDNC